MERLRILRVSKRATVVRDFSNLYSMSVKFVLLLFSVCLVGVVLALHNSNKIDSIKNEYCYEAVIIPVSVTVKIAFVTFPLV